MCRQSCVCMCVCVCVHVCVCMCACLCLCIQCIISKIKLNLFYFLLFHVALYISTLVYFSHLEKGYTSTVFTDVSWDIFPIQNPKNLDSSLNDIVVFFFFETSS